jgi:hypothetical protein
MVHSPYRPDHHAPVLMYVLWVVSFTGMFLAAAVDVTILAAHDALRRLKPEPPQLPG